MRFGHLLLAIGFAFLLPWPMITLSRWLVQRSYARAVAQLPEHVTVERGPDGGWVALVRSRGGDVSTLALPDGYDPRDDNGRFLLSQLLPDVDLSQSGEGEE